MTVLTVIKVFAPKLLFSLTYIDKYTFPSNRLTDFALNQMSFNVSHFNT